MKTTRSATRRAKPISWVTRFTIDNYLEALRERNAAAGAARPAAARRRRPATR